MPSLVHTWSVDDDQVRLEIKKERYGQPQQLVCAITRRHSMNDWQLWQQHTTDEEHLVAERRSLEAALLCAASLYALDPQAVDLIR